MFGKKNLVFWKCAIMFLSFLIFRFGDRTGKISRKPSHFFNSPSIEWSQKWLKIFCSDHWTTDVTGLSACDDWNTSFDVNYNGLGRQWFVYSAGVNISLCDPIFNIAHICFVGLLMSGYIKLI